MNSRSAGDVCHLARSAKLFHAAYGVLSDHRSWARWSLDRVGSRKSGRWWPSTMPATAPATGLGCAADEEGWKAEHRRAKIPIMRTAPLRRLVASLFAVLGALALVAGCGGDDEPTGAATPTPSRTGVIVPPGRVTPVPPKANFNAADVLFAQDMLLSLRHTEQLATLAQQRATDPTVKELAARVLKEREPGLILLPMWLEKYKQPMPSPSPLPGQTAPGAPSAQETAALSAATGDAFDRLFLQLLSRQDEAGMKLVTDQQWNGKNGPLISLTHKLQDDFEAELAAIRPKLGG